MTTLTAATPTTAGTLAYGQVPRPAAAAGVGLTGADVARILRQRLVLICVVWVLLSLVATGFSIYMRVYYPKYAAFSLVRVTSIRPRDVVDPLKRSIIDQKEIERELQNQALHVTSPAVLQAALEDPELRQTSWFREAEIEAKEEGDSVIDLLDDILSATPIRDSSYLRISAVWKVPKELPILVNTVVKKYVDKIDRQQRDSIRAASDQLSAELDRAKNIFEAKKREIEAFRQTSEFSKLGSKEAEETLLTLKALVIELDVEMLGRKTQWESLREAKPEDLPITPELQAILAQDPTIFELERNLLSAEQTLDLARQRFGENHRVVQEAKAARDAAAERVNRERAVKILRFQSQQIEQAKRDYVEAQEQLLELKQKLNEAYARQRDKEIKNAKYENLLDERDLLRFQYETLLEKKNAVEMTLRSKRSVQITVQSDAMEPKRISSPALSIWIPAGCILALALSVGLAFLLEVTDKSVRTPRDVLRAQLPVLGTIPSTDDDEVEIDRVETASLDAPHSIVAEAFRNLRANLFFSAPAEQQGVILVTSPSGGNGKTTVAANLAISIALSGRRVLLIDANFRRADLPRVFPNMKTEGLSNILIGQGYLSDYVVSTEVPGLDVLSAGPIPPNPAELLGSSYLRDVVVDARSRYDQVVFDGPPVLLVSDAMVLAGAVDGCLLVCQYRATSRGALQRTQASLEAINARIFGAVLNQVQSRAGGYFRKAYREFYEYQEPEESEEGVPRPQLDVSEIAAPPEPAPAGGRPGPDQGGSAEVAKAESGTRDEPLEDPADLPDFSDVEDLDIVEDHTLAPDAASGGDPTPKPAADLDDLGPADGDLGLGGELTDLDSDDFKLDDDFDLDPGSGGKDPSDEPDGKLSG